MEEYRVFPDHGDWVVYSGLVSYGDFVKRDIMFRGSITDCYAWIKCKQEGLFNV